LADKAKIGVSCAGFGVLTQALVALWLRFCLGLRVALLGFGWRRGRVGYGLAVRRVTAAAWKIAASGQARW